MTPNDFEQLEQQLESLIKITEELTKENRILRNSELRLLNERDRLKEKNDIAVTKIKTLLAQFKLLETNS